MFINLRYLVMLNEYNKLSDEQKQQLDMSLLRQDVKPSGTGGDHNGLFLPLATGLTEFSSVYEVGLFANTDLPELASVYQHFVCTGDEFAEYTGDRTREQVLADITLMRYNYADRYIYFLDAEPPSYTRVRFRIANTVGDGDDRVADVCKLAELLLLYIGGGLSVEEKAEVDATLASINRDQLVVSKKYTDIASFLPVFLEREHTARKILDRGV